MDRRELELLKQKRIQEAENKELEHRAERVARCLGDICLEGDDRNGSDSAQFKSKRLEITESFGWSTGSDGMLAGSGLVIKYDGEVVFQIGAGHIHSYVPGYWEKSLNSFYWRTKDMPDKMETKRPISEREERRYLESEAAKWS